MNNVDKGQVTSDYENDDNNDDDDDNEIESTCSTRSAGRFNLMENYNQCCVCLST